MRKQWTTLWRTGVTILAGFLLQSQPAQAATITVASCELSAVQSAVNSAANGDTVNVPAGTCTWSGALSLSKTITLKGAGALASGGTRINYGGSGHTLVSVSVSANTGKLDISGFYFYGGDANYWNGVIMQLYGPKGWKNLRVHHNVFDSNQNWTIKGDSGTNGLLDHNTFKGRGYGIMLYGDGAADWAKPLTLGTADFFFIEDNTFDWDDFYGSTGVPVMDMDSGGRQVFRYNTIKHGMWETHDKARSGLVSANAFEIYKNNFSTSSNKWKAIDVTAGTGVVWGNTFTGDFTVPIGAIDYKSFDPRSVRLCDGTDPADKNVPGETGWICQYQIGSMGEGPTAYQYPLYNWNNTENGAQIGMQCTDGCNHVKAGRDFINNGTTPKPGYVAYPYPHPLQDGGSTPPPPPPANMAPSVSISSPSSGASFSAGSNIAINASASDSDGSISKVEFFNGSTKLGEDLTSPYSLTMSNVAAGSYSLVARATDNAGAVTNSVAVSITVNAVAPPPANVAPSVSISSPSSGASFSAGMSISISANASDSDGSVSKVEFFNGSTKLGEDLSAPYSYTIASAAAGSYSLIARATDNSGAVTNSSAVSITVNSVTQPPPANVGPSVSITSPSNGSSFSAGSSIAINANASDSDGSIAKVEFFNGSTKLGEDLSAPYSLTMSNVAAGSYSLIARATDNAGAIASSAAVSITVNAVTQPPPSGTSVTLLTSQVPAQSNLNDGMSYELGMRFTSTAAGKITAIRFLKASSETGTHTGKIYSSSGALLASVVFSSETASGWQQMNLASPLSIAANTEYTVSVNTGAGYYVATNNGMASQISNGSLRSVVGNNGVYGPVGSRPTNSYESSNYFRDIVFIADSGGTTPPPPPVGDVSAPVASITSPVNGSQVTASTTVSIQASASDDVGVVKVEFYVNGTLKCTDSVAPYSCNWAVSRRVGRTHQLQVKAYDASGKVGNSAIVSVTSK